MRIPLPADATAPHVARSFVTDQLTDRRLPSGVTVSDVVLIASELATNAVRSGAGRIALSLSWAGPLELSVEDDGQGWPVPVAATLDDVGGRGLRIVDELAHSWRVTPTATGKRVTARWA